MVIRSLTEAKSNRMPKGSPNLSYSLYQKKLSYSRCANIQVSDRVGSVRGALFLRRSFFLSVPLYQCAWFERMTPGHHGGVGWRFLMVKDDSSDSIKWDRCIKESLWKFYFIINEIFVLSRNLEVVFQKTLRGQKLSKFNGWGCREVSHVQGHTALKGNNRSTQKKREENWFQIGAPLVLISLAWIKFIVSLQNKKELIIPHVC